MAGGEIIEILTCSPGFWDELALGYLASQGIKITMDDIIELDVDDNSGHALIKIRPLTISSPGVKNGDEVISLKEYISRKRITTIYGENKNRGKNSIDRGDAQTVLRTQVLSLVKQLEGLSRLYHLTRGSHIAILARGWEILTSRSDISRRSAINKIMGSIVKSGMEGRDIILLVSCRMTEDIVLMVGDMGIKTMISVAAPTVQGLEAARATGILLIGSVEGEDMTIYWGEERVKME